MKFASVAEARNNLSSLLARSRRRKETVVITHHGKPFAVIRPISERDLEELEWKEFAKDRLRRAWEGEDDALYNYL